MQFNTDRANNAAIYGYDLVRVWQKELKRDYEEYQVTWPVPTKKWSERTFFQLENTQHLAVAHSQNHAAGTPPPYWAYQRCMKNPVVTQLGSRCDNFTVHESHGLGVYPSTYYINPNNVHHHLDQGPRAIHVHSAFTSIWKQHCASGSVKWPFPVWRAKSQQRREEAKRKCHCYLVELHSLDKLQRLWF